jgi:hypothetical protein
VSVARDGSTVYVTGGSEGLTSAGDYATVAYRAGTASRPWVRRYGPEKVGGSAMAVASPGNGRVYVTGSVFGGSRTAGDYATVAYSSGAGKQLWVKRYNGPASSEDRASAMAVSPDRSKVFVTGLSYHTRSIDTVNEDYATVAYSAVTGRQLWVKRYDGPYRTHSAEANSVSVSPAGGCTSPGPARGRPGNLTGITPPSPTPRPPERSCGSGATARPARVDVARMVASPGNGKVYVTGTSYNTARGTDFATVAYNAATGARLWVSRYNGPARGEDYAEALAVSPDRAKIFVTGTTGAELGSDYATIAYNG